MKKLLAVVLCTAIILSLGACGSKSSYDSLIEDYISAINSGKPSNVTKLYAHCYQPDTTDTDELWVEMFALYEHIYGEDYKVKISGDMEYKKIDPYDEENPGNILSMIDVIAEKNIAFEECGYVNVPVEISGSKNSDTKTVEIVTIKIDGKWYIYYDSKFLLKFVNSYIED